MACFKQTKCTDNVMLRVHQDSNFIVAIVTVASDKGKLAIDKMKLYLRFKATFGPDAYFRKVLTYLANCMDIFL